MFILGFFVFTWISWANPFIYLFGIIQIIQCFFEVSFKLVFRGTLAALTNLGFLKWLLICFRLCNFGPPGALEMRPHFACFTSLLSALALVKGSVQVTIRFSRSHPTTDGKRGLTFLSIKNWTWICWICKIFFRNPRKDTWTVSYAFVSFEDENREHIAAQCSK